MVSKYVIEKYGSEEAYKEYIHKKLSGKHFYTNGVEDRKFADDEEIPEGWYKGRTNYGKGTKDTKWITNGEIQRCLKNSDSLPDGFRYGKLPHNDVHKKNLSKALKGRVFTKEWCENISNSHKTVEYKHKIESTCLKKYGVKNPYNKPEVIAKVHSKEMIERQNNTKRKNGTFNSSKAEDKFYEYLLTKFDSNDIYRQYYDKERYSYACDFYIKSLDLFIECNFHWTHNDHWFDENDSNDINTLNLWKSKKSKYYDVAINTWTVLDVKKYNYSKNLNFIVLWNQNTAVQDFEKLISSFV